MSPKHAEALGRLQKLNVHDHWKNEAQDFTPWLAQEENIALLGEELAVDLEVQQSEQPVGPYRADLVCVDTATGHKVLIENQLEKTNHTHLGQILTYAAGLDAVVIVWIADRFTDEHRAALDWLNDVTGPGINFFGFEIELWRISDSPPAPKFNVIVRPNEWTKPPPSKLTETELLYLEYWTAFREYAADRKTPIRVGKPLPQSWLTFPLGRSNFYLTANISRQRKVMYAQCVIYGDDHVPFFRLLNAGESEIRSEFGEELEWRELPEGRESHVRRSFENTDPTQRSDWPRQHQLILETLERLHRVFAPRVKALDASDWDTGEGDD